MKERLILKFSFLLFVSILLASCGSQVFLLQNSSKYATLKKRTKIYPVDTTSLGSLDPIELKSDLKTRILFRDATKSNLADALIFIENPKDSIYTNNYSKSVIKNGVPFYLLPRTKYGKATDYNAYTKVKTRSRDVGVLFNPYQLFFTLKKPIYVEENFAKRLKLGACYTWNFITHKYNDLNYTRTSYSVGPYFMLGTTSISPISLDTVRTINGLNTLKPVFGISMGGIVNYQFNDFFGTAIMVGHEQIFGQYRKDWTFTKNNVSLGLVFTFKFSRI